MSKTQIEPFLEDYCSAFHSIFTLMDPSMNTSEIKPLHLAIPRIKQALRPSASLQQGGKASPTLTPTGNSKKNGSPGPRLLNKTIIKKTQDPLLEPKIRKRQKQENTPDVNQTPKSQDTKVVVKVAKSPESTPQKLVKDELQPLQAPIFVSKENQDAISTITKSDDYLIMPIPPSLNVIFEISVDENGPQTIFKLYVPPTRNNILTAIIQDPHEKPKLQLYQGDKPIGRSSITTHSTFYVGVDTDQGTNEAAAAVFTNVANDSVPKNFEFIIPALKKIEGRSRMLPIKFGESSGLMYRLSQLSKEAIHLKTRMPMKNGKSYDLTFDGKFPVSCPTNLSIFHESNYRKDICNFFKNKDGSFALELRFPISPIQGFIAAIATAIQL
ncbi:tubby-related protein 1-like [Histomonas meleagridis]|uniref:tubby-related protein 1-like n=1 Tax=Histomonas meleagridis TaxID=135588 RepID=UPI00355A819E|nr:tubby-related protein 1-like [Histomonas meleagridis]KAH0801572.1 tubby-related protein 1-like [Histomonas meleagridis]